MDITLYAKKGKPGLTEVIEYLNTYFNRVTLHLGERRDEFPYLFTTPDIVISYMSPWIIPPTVLEQTKLWNINFHPGSPDYPGIGCTNFAIYNGEKEYGVTAHIMEEKVDSGEILGIKKFSISKEDTVFSLTQKSYRYLLVLFYDVFNHFLHVGGLPESKRNWTRKPYTRKELNELCRITPGMPKEEIRRRIKATKYPGMPGVYMDNGRK